MSHPSIQEIYCTMSKILTIIIRKKIKNKKKSLERYNLTKHNDKPQDAAY